MGEARTVILVAATAAGEAAARLPGCSDKSAPPPAAPIVRLPTIDVLVAKNAIGPGQPVKPEEVQWQTCPAATASATFIRRADRPTGTPRLGAIARAPFMQGETIRDLKLVKAHVCGVRAAMLPRDIRAVVGRTVLLELKPEQTETLARARQSGTLSMALRSIADVNAKEPTSDEPTRKRGESISIIRFGVPSQMTAQK